MRRAAPVVALAGLAALAAGCGEIRPDLFLLTRTGSIAGAALTLQVSDDGSVRCNGGRKRQMTDPELLSARDVATQLGGPAKKKTAFAPGPASVLRYSVRLPSGSIRFADDSRGLTKPYFQLQKFTRTVAIGVCHLPR